MPAAAAADGQRFEGDLVTDALDEDDGPGTRCPRQRHGGRLGGGLGAAHVTGQGVAGKLTAPADLHDKRGYRQPSGRTAAGYRR